MKILAADSDLRDLTNLLVILARLLPAAEIFASLGAEDSLDFARTHNITTAFLDSSIDIGEKFHELSPGTHIITTPKPIVPEAVSSLLQQDVSRLYVQTFGGFGVFRADGKPLDFERSKTRELLALLVDRRGCPLSVREICAVLFEDKKYTKSQGSYYRILLVDLLRTLRAEGAENIIWRGRNCIAVNTSAFDCDAYQFLRGDAEALRKYRGDYMSCYSWAEYSFALFGGNDSQSPNDSPLRRK